MGILKIIGYCQLFVAGAAAIAGQPAGGGEFITYGPVVLTAAEKAVLKQGLDGLHGRYDPSEKMLTRELNGWNYHTDAESGTYHDVRASFSYAAGLLDLGDKALEKRAFDIIERTISLQDTVAASRTCGVWPYYMEEPLATKKSPVDFNWADFNAVSLLDIYMGHEQKLPEQLKTKVRKALVLAAGSVHRRNVQPGYTNIAIMGTYVTFVTSHLFGIEGMQGYAADRLKRFYGYTLERGFTEYNSPTYTIVSLDELSRMQRHIVEPVARAMIDSLYNLGWEVIAKHFHQPSGQWAGPHSRSYRSLATESFYGILKQASGGKIDIPGAAPRTDVKIRHKMPDYLLSYFLSPVYPRLQEDIFTIDDPRIKGTTYLTAGYAFSSAGRSSLWNQRRPFLVYWGTAEAPRYLQLRFLHDGYDFSAAAFYAQQKEGSLIGGINFMTNGGDKHISIDRLKDGRFTAKDLRMRFEFGNCPDAAQLHIPSGPHEAFSMVVGQLQFELQLFRGNFGSHAGYWEKGSDGKTSWLDFVLYAGEAKDFDLTRLPEAVLGFVFRVARPGEMKVLEKAAYEVADGVLNARWEGMEISVPVKPDVQPKNL